MSEEEALLLEQEGRAALSEMGEFVPDPDDAISQAEIDEPFAPLPPAENFRIFGRQSRQGRCKGEILAQHQGNRHAEAD